MTDTVGLDAWIGKVIVNLQALEFSLRLFLSETVGPKDETLNLDRLMVGDWVLEFYTGVWLFETNDNFFGGQVRKQDPLGVFQTHIVYNVLPGLWAAVDFAYYTGGSTSVDGKPQNDRQDNTRGGLTLSVPITRGQSLKLAWARGVSTRVGSSFETVALAWQLMWF